MSSTRSERRYRAKVARQNMVRDRKVVNMGEVPDGAQFYPHPKGGILVAHPDHPLVWHKLDGTKEVIKP